MAKRSTTELAFSAIRIEGSLLAADFLGRVARFEATGQAEADYDIPKGLKLRDEIGRYWKIALNLWQDFQAGRQRTDHDAHSFTGRDFLEPFCRHVLGFTDIQAIGQVVLDERIFPIGYQAVAGQVPLVFAAHSLGLEQSDARFGDGHRRRSPFLLAQEYLNAENKCLWAIVSNGLKLRILRDNPSLTRPAYIEVDLESIFNEERYPDFTAFWLLAHATRFGRTTPSPLTGEGRGEGVNPADCHLERWRNTSQESGIRARERLRDGVGEALRALGTGFVSHPKNTALREQLDSGTLTAQAYYEQLLRLIYRFIFLATLEDRQDEQRGRSLVFAPDADESAQELYLRGYSLNRLREHAAKRRHYDRYSDLWQGLGIAFAGLAKGQPALGLPALGGLFTAEQCRHLDGAQLENRYLLQAVFGLCFFREGAALTRVNYRDMGSEELGSVYESLLELVPVVSASGGSRKFGFVGDEEKASTKGNARKLSGSYYTPDSLVQELIKSALEPVIAQTLQANPQQPVKALLGLTVCDPACGSGHFLLAAARRIAEEVARLNAREGNPLQSDYRHALREVVAHCIYGVDKNPMAVELAKTALWLEAYTPDRPLTFLDHHLRCGDALLGVLDPAILQHGIPAKAFDALSGDDKAVVKALKKANSDALKAIEKSKANTRNMLSLGLEEATEIRNLEALPDDTLEAIAAKRAAFAQVEVHAAQSRARIAADLFVAAFVLPKTLDNQPLVPTSQDLWLVMNGSAPRPGVQEVATQAAHVAQAFHWQLAFPQIFSPRPQAGEGAGERVSGFDVLLGNPPWEVSQMGEEEYFSARAPSIAALSGEKRKRAIAALETDNPFLWQGYLCECQRIEACNTFFRESGRFPLTAFGKLNSYPLFAETFAQLMSEHGRAGFIVPTGIATDDSTKAYFEAVSQGGRLVSMKGFWEIRRIFPDTDSRDHFCLLTLGASPVAEFVFQAKEVDDLSDMRRRFALTPEEFRLINPNTRTCPVFRSERDAELSKKLYRAAPVLIVEGPPEKNPWGISFSQGLFNMTSDSGLFYNEAGANRFPLYEAKMIHQFDHRWATYQSSSIRSAEEVATESRDVTDSEKSISDFIVTPRYWVDATEVKQRLADKGWERNWMIAWRGIARATDERSVIGGLLPISAVGNSCHLVFPSQEIQTEYIAGFVANISMLVFDYVARQKLGGANFNFFIPKQLPVLPPESYTETDLAFIVPRVLELTYTAYDLKPWAEDLGYDGEPFPWNPDRRAILRAELDAYYAKLYSLTRDELRYILDPADVMGDDYPSETFRVLMKNEMREFGEYRTRRLVLAAWDQLACNGVSP